MDGTDTSDNLYLMKFQSASSVYTCSLLQDISVVDVDNEISQTQLQKLQVASKLERVHKALDEMNVSTHQQNELLSKSEAMITRNNVLIEQKQTQIDQMNKKIDYKLSSMDGVSQAPPKSGYFTPKTSVTLVKLEYVDINYVCSF